MASFPASVRNFLSKTNTVDIVEANDYNELAAEIAAIERTLGVNVHNASARTPTATNLVQRLAALDIALSTIESRYTEAGLVPSNSVVGLTTALADITTALADKVTQAAFSTLVTTVGGKASTASVDTERNDRVAALTALTSRVTTLERRFRTAETQYQNNGSYTYASSNSYQNLFLPNASYSTSDYGTQVNGHNLVSFSGTQTRFNTDFSGSSDLYVFTCTATFAGTGTTANAGVRGLRLVTSTGAVLTEMNKNASQDPGDDTLTVAWSGRVSGAVGYFVTPQVMQNSGGSLTIAGHTASKPTFMTMSRIPG